MLSRISARQFGEWMAFYSIEPWGLKVDNLLTALPALMLAQIYRRKGGRKPKLDDFLLFDRKERVEQTQGQIVAAIIGGFEDMGAKVPEWAKRSKEAWLGNDS